MPTAPPAAVSGSGTNTAAAGDFVGGVLPSGTVGFAAGETSKLLTIQVAGDTLVEPDEGFTVTLSAPSAGATIAVATATGTIRADDTDVPTATAGPDTLTGTSGPDSLAGLGGNDSLNGADGNDELDGGDGDDTLSGGAGDDYLLGGAGNNLLTGGAGNDTLDGQDGTSTADYSADPGGVSINLGYGSAIDGWGGSDVLINIRVVMGSAFANSILGSDGGDTLIGSLGADSIDGGAGFDVLTYAAFTTSVVVDLDAGVGPGGSEIDRIEGVVGGNGDDMLLGDAQANQLSGGASNDLLSGGAGNDTLLGQAGRDTLLGGVGDDILDGGTGADQMIGGAGNDLYRIDDSNDVVIERSGGGTDTVETTLASYLLPANVEYLVFTGTGNFAGTGNSLSNRLTGGLDDDTLSGGAGNDILRGGGGRDLLIGGAGTDRFVFDTASLGPASTHTVTIQDFDRTVPERIDLSAIDAKAGTAANDAFKFIGAQAFGGVAGQLRWTDAGATKLVEGDVNGDGIADLTISIVTAEAVAASWFIL